MWNTVFNGPSKLVMLLVQYSKDTCVKKRPLSIRWEKFPELENIHMFAQTIFMAHRTSANILDAKVSMHGRDGEININLCILHSRLRLKIHTCCLTRVRRLTLVDVTVIGCRKPNKTTTKLRSNHHMRPRIAVRNSTHGRHKNVT
jgi:hypothetical protein